MVLTLDPNASRDHQKTVPSTDLSQDLAQTLQAGLEGGSMSPEMEHQMLVQKVEDFMKSELSSFGEIKQIAKGEGKQISLTRPANLEAHPKWEPEVLIDITQSHALFAKINDYADYNGVYYHRGNLGRDELMQIIAEFKLFLETGSLPEGTLLHKESYEEPYY